MLSPADSSAYMQTLSEEELNYSSKNNPITLLDNNIKNCHSSIALITDSKGTYQSPSGVGCCCADVIGVGSALGFPAGLFWEDRKYHVEGASNYFWKFKAYKDNSLAFESFPFLTDLFSPNPNCPTGGSFLTLPQIFNGCSGYCKFIFTKFYRKNGIDIICDTDEFSFYWSALPGWPPCL